MTEMPWVVQTRLAPGQKMRRNPVWGIVACVLSLGVAAMFVTVIVAVFLLDPRLFGQLLPFWGILTLTAVAFIIIAFSKKGIANTVLAIVSIVIVLCTNPVLMLVIVSSLGML